METNDTNILRAEVVQDQTGECGLVFLLKKGNHESFFTEDELRTALAEIEAKKL